MSKILIDEATVKLALEALGLYARTLAPTETQKKGLEAVNALNEAQAVPVQEPAAMRMPKVGDKVVCIDDESLGTVVYLTAGGSPEIKFDDGSHGTYMLREFAELFGYTTLPAQEFICSTGLCHYKPAAPDLQAELNATNKQVEILSDALAESRREVAALTAVQEPVQEFKKCGLCGEDQPFTGACGGGRENPKALCFIPPAAPVPEPAELTHIGEQDCLLDVDERAWRSLVKNRGGCRCHISPPCGACSDPISEEELNELGYTYTTPPAAQRPWVGLTNEERLALEYTPQKVKRSPIEMSFATEAKLKEKNT